MEIDLIVISSMSYEEEDDSIALETLKDVEASKPTDVEVD